MAKRTLTLSDWWEVNGPRIAGGLRRALIGAVLITVFILVAASTAAQSPHPPKPPWWYWSNWLKWFNENPQDRITALISAIGAAGGFAIGIFQVWFSEAAKRGAAEHFKRLEDMEGRISGEIQGVKTSLLRVSQRRLRGMRTLRRS